MVAERAEIDLADFGRYLESMQDRIGNLDMTIPLKGAQIDTKADVKRNFVEGHTPEGDPWAPLAHSRANSKGADKPLRNKGLLMASIAAFGEGNIDDLTSTSMQVGTNLEYAELHQDGGTITPKGHPYLAIPATVEAGRYRSPRNFPRKLAFVKRKGHTPILIEEKAGRGKNNTGAKAILQYWLVASVTVPSRRFAGFSERLLTKIDARFLDYATKQV